MFAINKNGTKHKIGIIMPAFFPASRITHESVSVTADGVKTNKDLQNELFAAVDKSKITPWSVLIRDTSIFQVTDITNTDIYYSSHFIFTGVAYLYTMRITASNSNFVREELPSNTISNFSTNIPSAGLVYTLYY